MEINKKLLLDIFRIPAESKKEQAMGNFIKSYLHYIQVPFRTDRKGNIFSFNGKKPFLSAHMDTVQDNSDTNLAQFIDIIRDSIISGLGVIGGDDKCGIYIILHILTELENKSDINFAFTVEEEIGTVGARYLANNNKQELSDCLYGIVLDRRGSSDIICQYNGYGTLDFDNELEELGKKFNYKTTYGVLSDADVFKKFMSCANLSCGYYRAHTKQEFVIIRHLENALNFTRDILINIKDSFDAPVELKTYKYGYWNGNPKKNEGWYDDPEMEEYFYGIFDNENNKKKGTKIVKTLPKDYDNCGMCYGKNNLKFLESLQDFFCDGCIRGLIEELMEKFEEEAL